MSKVKFTSIMLLTCFCLCSCSKDSTNNRETDESITSIINYDNESVLHRNKSGLYFTISDTRNTYVTSAPSRERIYGIDPTYSTLTLVVSLSDAEQEESGVEKIYYVSADSEIIEQFIKIRQQGIDLEKDIVLHCDDIDMTDVIRNTRLMTAVNSMIFMSLVSEDYSPLTNDSLGFLNQCLSQPDDFEVLSKSLGFTDKVYTDFRDAAMDYLFCNMSSGRVLVKIIKEIDVCE